MSSKRNRRIVIRVISLSLLLGHAGITRFIPSVEATSPSASALIIIAEAADRDLEEAARGGDGGATGLHRDGGGGECG
jgi:hypothetical protein